MTVLDRIIERMQALGESLDDIDAVEIEPVGDPDVFPALELYDGGDGLIVHEAGITRSRLVLTFEGYVQRGDGLQATAERNKLHADLVRAVMADETLGGLVEGVEPGDRRTATAVLGEHRRLMFAQDFTIDFATDRYDPALPA